jgi:glycosyltransferase involved in cell wall biosynthesis
MKIVQAVLGAFHHFDLARELHDRHHLTKIYSTWPWARLKREGVPREFVESFVPFHTGNYLLARLSFYPKPVYQAVERFNLVAFDRWLSWKLPPCDAFIALSGVGFKTGQLAQKRGARFICDRGSTHHRHQSNVLVEEYARWGVPNPPLLPRQTALEERSYAIADAITVPSSRAVQSFVNMGIPASKVHCIPYGVRLDRFTPTGTPPDIRERFEAVFVGQVSLRKGIPYLLEAFAKVQHPNKRLRVIGSPNPDFLSILGRLPQHSVEFLGGLPQAELPAIFSSSHALVLASVEEGLALVQAQAMACGCPVIATTATGCEDLYTNGVEGFIVDDRDVDALARSMQCLIDTPGLQQQLSAAALERVRTIGGWREYGDRWETLLYRLTGQSPPQA